METEKMKERYVVAMDSFKGCLTSQEACTAVAQGLREYRGAEAVEVPVSDGGDGMTEALKGSITGYEERHCQTHDALMRPCDAVYLISGEKVIIEVAQACGISRLKGETLRPLSATSFGVGELLIDAIRTGGRQFYIGLGGTASSDCGLGMLQAFKEGWLRMHGTFDVGLRTWTDVAPQLESLGLQVTLLSDVTNPLRLRLRATEGCQRRGGAPPGAQGTVLLPHVSVSFRLRLFAKSGCRRCGRLGLRIHAIL